MDDVTYLKTCREYSDLGYDLYLTSICGKDGIRMTKRYSYKFEGQVHSQQIWSHDRLDKENLHTIVNFMYKDIQEQEESGEIRDIYF